MLVFGGFLWLRSAVINWARYYIYLSKGAFFILGLVFSHSLVNNGVVSTLISYLTDNWKTLNLPKAAIIVNVQDGVSAILVIIVAHISDAYIGRFKVTVYCTAAYIIGLVILSLSTNNQIFFLAAVLIIAIGKAGRDPPLKAFLADQLTEHRQNMDIDEERVESRTKFWWRVMGFLGATISTIWISKFSWTRVFKISAIVMGVAYLFFWFGINFYHCKKPTGSPFSIIYRVLKAAILNSDQDYPNTAGGYFKNDSGQLLLLPHIPFFRWLDKAAIVESSSLGLEEQEMKSRLCTVTEVKQVKDLLLLVPMWTTIFFYGLVEATESAFFIQQSSNMDNYIGNNFEVPINAFFLFRSFTGLTIPYLIELLITKWWSEAKQQHAALVRIGVGLFCSILCCITAWQVEVHRLFLIKKNGIIDDGIIPMSIFWLAPQYFLLGLMDAFVTEGLRDFFYDHVAESMKLSESSFNDCVLGIGNFLSIPCIFVFRSWFGDKINTSHLDKYFLMLAILGFVNLCFYGLVSYKYYACEEAPSDDVELDSIIVEDGQAHLAPESLTTNLISDSRFINWTVNGMRSRSLHQHTTTKVLLRRYPTFR